MSSPLSRKLLSPFAEPIRSGGEECGLTPPSSGRLARRFAPVKPPLMSNVRRQMPRTACVTVFQGDTAVDIEVQRRAVEVSFASEREELVYQESDWNLRELSGRVFGARESLVHVVEDWWPNRTALLEADERA